MVRAYIQYDSFCPIWNFNKKNKRGYQNKAMFFYLSTVSLLFEIIQYILSIGSSDITDIITNTLGGLVGVLVVSILRKIVKK